MLSETRKNIGPNNIQSCYSGHRSNGQLFESKFVLLLEKVSKITKLCGQKLHKFCLVFPIFQCLFWLETKSSRVRFHAQNIEEPVRNQ